MKTDWSDPMIARDEGPLKRLRGIQADQNAPREIFQRVAEGETLNQIARSWEVPKGLFVEWFLLTHGELYEAALKVRADDLAHEALVISDEQAEVKKEDGSTFDPNVPRDKLRIDTRLKLASKWDRSRYGDKHDVNVSVTQWVVRLPTPASNSIEWQQSLEKVINTAPTPALEAVPQTARAPDVETA